jgi:hypothetical protein
MPVYSLTLRNRVALAVFTIGVLALGAVFLTVGLALLLALVAGGAVLGAGVAVVRLLRGGQRRTPRTELESMHAEHAEHANAVPAGERRSALDPTLEVRQIAPAVIRPRDNND